MNTMLSRRPANGLFLDPFDLLFKNMLDESATFSPLQSVNLSYPTDIGFDKHNVYFHIPIVDGNIDDIKVTRTPDELRVEYHRSESEKQSEIKWIHKKVVKRDFNFSWKVSPKWDIEAMETSYKGGLLSITIPFKKEALPVQVQIKSGE